MSSSAATEGRASKHARRQEKRKREAEAAQEEDAEAAPAKKNRKHNTNGGLNGEGHQNSQASEADILRRQQRKAEKKARRAREVEAPQHHQAKHPAPITASEKSDIAMSDATHLQTAPADTTEAKAGPTNKKAKKEAKQARLLKERLERRAAKDPRPPNPSARKGAERANKHNTVVSTAGSADKKALLRHKREQIAAWKASSKDGWTVSQPTAGRFIDCKPYLTADERYAGHPTRLCTCQTLTPSSRLICATETAIHVYTTSNSLLEHTLPSRDDGAVSCYAWSEDEANVIYMATDASRIIAWDISTAKVLGNWTIANPISSIKVSSVHNSAQRLIFTITQTGRWHISAHRFGIGSAVHNETQALLKHDKPLQSLQVLRQGEILIAISSESLIVGKRTGSSPESLKDLRYAWREIKCAEAPISFEARLSNNAAAGNKAVLDVAVGGLKGCIYIYQDLLLQLGLERQNSTSLELAEVMATRSLHWHRESVDTVAWSADGNYLISGGTESVLVLWQLDTGKKQFLPNLESSIRAVTVSPTGASYVVRLGDNSIMVLSTSELTPTSNIANLQSYSLPSAARFRPELPTMEMWSTLNKPLDSSPQIQAVINPLNPSHLLAAVCSFQRDSNIMPTLPSAPYLQTFDISRSRNVARQALTRTNATNFNMGPEGNRIAEPDVKHVQVSSNGQWLATVDEWSPYPADVEDLTADLQDARGAVDQQRTVQLRFWSWQEADKDSDGIWALNSRIDSPHMLDDSQTPGSVFHLVASPAGAGFATIGQDSNIKIWEPRTKFSNGKVIRGESLPGKPGKGQTTWSLRRQIALEKGMSSEPSSRLVPTHAKLAYSQDGSTLAASQHFEVSAQHRESSLIHFIDPEDDHVHQSRADIFSGSGGVAALAFLGRHLICLGQDEAVVWDITTMEMHARIAIPLTQNAVRPAPLLAVNVSTSTFAIAYPITSLAKPPLSTIPLRAFTSVLQIFSVTGANKNVSCPMWSATLPRLALSLLSAGGLQGETSTGSPVGTKGYVVVDAGATVRTIRPLSSVETGSVTVANSSENLAETEQVMAVDQQGESSDDEEPDDAATAAAVVEPETADRLVVRPEELAQLLDHPAHAMPPMHELFDNVLRLYAPKAAVVKA